MTIKTETVRVESTAAFSFLKLLRSFCNLCQKAPSDGAVLLCAVSIWGFVNFAYGVHARRFNFLLSFLFFFFQFLLKLNLETFPKELHNVICNMSLHFSFFFSEVISELSDRIL